MSRDSQFAKQLCGLCATICEACAAECAKHDNPTCQSCAEACRNCATECHKMSA
ncbi:four-helix bundle copper-binding protein [Ferroacidibacillus organovorans]|uniref:four-helix bundle copper-binding protein n=1 Tax=Ferroacidibacillus organovorans TaxID=1765683 RepID=UPI003AAE2483